MGAITSGPARDKADLEGGGGSVEFSDTSHVPG